MTARGGFTIVELLVSTLITILVAGAVLAAIAQAQSLVRAQADAADEHQRLRAAADALSTDIRTAIAIRPYRVGALRDDGAAGVFYRPDTIAAIGDTARTYYFKPDTAQLMVYDGGASDLPMVEHVVALAFDYFGGAPLTHMAPAGFVDGPWLQDASGRRVDADAQRIREVRVSIRLEVTTPSLRPLIGGGDVNLVVALRNVNGGAP